MGVCFDYCGLCYFVDFGVFGMGIWWCFVFWLDVVEFCLMFKIVLFEVFCWVV